jgi:hypothetical protein
VDGKFKYVKAKIILPYRKYIIGCDAEKKNKQKYLEKNKFI